MQPSIDQEMLADGRFQRLRVSLVRAGCMERGKRLGAEEGERHHPPGAGRPAAVVTAVCIAVDDDRCMSTAAHAAGGSDTRTRNARDIHRINCDL